MTNRFPGILRVMAGVIVMMSLLPVSAAGQATSNQWTVPRTPDGHPDLQGVWANNNATPLERPKVLEDRAVMTDEELARVKARYAELFSGTGDAAFLDSVFVAALSETEEFTSNDGGTGNYNQFWLVDREFDNRTSLITDPPNGRLPALTPEAEQRQTARFERRRDHPADSWEDRGLSERCITFGSPKFVRRLQHLFADSSNARIRHHRAGDDPRRTHRPLGWTAAYRRRDPAVAR